MQRLRNDSLGRMLHNQLYQTIKNFCEQYTPELPAEPVVGTWLSRLYNGDESLHILVRLNDRYEIIAHAVIDIQEAYNCHVVVCHQAHSIGNKLEYIAEGVEYIDKLVNETHAACSLITLVKHVTAFQKKFHYTIARTVMIKGRSDDVFESDN